MSFGIWTAGCFHRCFKHRVLSLVPTVCNAALYLLYTHSGLWASVIGYRDVPALTYSDSRRSSYKTDFISELNYITYTVNCLCVSAGSCLCAFVVLQWHDSVSTKSVSTVLPFSYCCCCRYSTAASAAKVLAFEYRSVWLNLICLFNMFKSTKYLQWKVGQNEKLQNKTIASVYLLKLRLGNCCWMCIILMDLSTRALYDSWESLLCNRICCCNFIWQTGSYVWIPVKQTNGY